MPIRCMASLQRSVKTIRRSARAIYIQNFTYISFKLKHQEIFCNISSNKKRSGSSCFGIASPIYCCTGQSYIYQKLLPFPFVFCHGDREGEDWACGPSAGSHGNSKGSWAKLQIHIKDITCLFKYQVFGNDLAHSTSQVIYT